MKLYVKKCKKIQKMKIIYKKSSGVFLFIFLWFFPSFIVFHVFQEAHKCFFIRRRSAGLNEFSFQNIYFRLNFAKHFFSNHCFRFLMASHSVTSRGPVHRKRNRKICRFALKKVLLNCWMRFFPWYWNQ